MGSGVKNFLGNTKQFVGNLMIGAGEKGICCYQSDGGNGHSNHVFANNTCIYGANRTDGGETLCLAHTGMPYVPTPGHVQPYRRTLHCTPNTTQLGSPAFKAWMQVSGPHDRTHLNLSYDRIVPMSSDYFILTSPVSISVFAELELRGVWEHLSCGGWGWEVSSDGARAGLRGLRPVARASADFDGGGG